MIKIYMPQSFPKKAVILTAGYGTRFLPITKTIPKEMLPVLNKPLIQLIVEQIVKAGIENIIFITSPHKKALEDYFDRHLELENQLKKTSKKNELQQIKNLADLAHFIFVRQKEMRGTGQAILRAKPIVQKETFLVFWGDDLIKAQPPIIEQLKKWFKKLDSTLLTAMFKPEKEATNAFAYVTGKETKDYIEVKEIIEKPGPKKAKELLPWAIFSPFVFTPKILQELALVKKPKKEEIFYVDGLKRMLKKGEKIYAIKIKNAKFYSCGNILDYLKMIVEFALADSKINHNFKEFLKQQKL